MTKKKLLEIRYAIMGDRYFCHLPDNGGWVWDDCIRTKEEALTVYPLDKYQWVEIP